MTNSRLFGLILTAFLSVVSAYCPVLAFDIADPNSRQELPAVELQDKVKAQEAAARIAREALIDIQRNRKSDAACLIRNAVRQAMNKSPDFYAHFILELNEQLESKNILQVLGLNQRPHAALSKAQYDAELGLYGHRTLPASVLSMIGPEAIHQGSLGDCWFLSTLAVIANDHPQLIPSMISVNEDASYTVKFPGFPNKVLVKALSCNTTRAVGARSTSYGDWPFVLECAAIAVFPHQMRNGGKANLALKLLTGVDSSIYALSPSRTLPVLSNRELNETVVAALETNQSVMLASTLDGPLPRNHAYSVIDIIPANEEHPTLISVRNPWGRMGFDPIRANLNDIEAGNDGVCTLPVTSLSKYFNDVVVPSSALRLCREQNTPASYSSSTYSSLPSLPRSYISPTMNQPRSDHSSSLPKVPHSYLSK